jgi:hypothetical protein
MEHQKIFLLQLNSSVRVLGEVSLLKKILLMKTIELYASSFARRYHVRWNV